MTERMRRAVCGLVVMVFILGLFVGGWVVSMFAAKPLVQVFGLGEMMLITGLASILASYGVFLGVMRLLGIDPEGFDDQISTPQNNEVHL